MWQIGGGGQGGETFQAQTGLLIPADTSASGYYVPNAYNSFIGLFFCVLLRFFVPAKYNAT